MRLPHLLALSVAILPFSLPAGVSAETREEYLARLKEVCALDCMQPREFQRKARKVAKGDAPDMAIIMDVAYVTRAGDKLQLHNLNLESSYFEVLDVLASAGINTSQRDGIGGLPRGQRPRAHPNVIMIELDEATLFDLLNPPSSAPQSGNAVAAGGDIVVEDDRDREFNRATLAALKAKLLNRRIVVRGSPRLEVAWIGARRDFRRKQVILDVDNADDLVMLPRYDDDGNPQPDENLPWLKAQSTKHDK